MPKLVLAASLLVALILAACGGSTSAPSQPAVSAPPVSQAPSSPEPSSAPTPAPTADPTPAPTPRPTSVAFSRAERYLIDGILRGESDCSPVRAGLPDRAVAGIDCDLVGSPAARVGYYLFENDADMLDAYIARMRAEGVALDSGDCREGEGESAFIPWGDEGIAPDRTGCFINDAGYANYRITLGGPHVYIGLLGRTADIRALEDWAWFGSTDTPGNPTLWYQSVEFRP